MNNIWHTDNPSKNGKYLCTINISTLKPTPYLKILSWANSLKTISKYDFSELGQDKAGWYEYDSEYGFFEYTDVVAWTELPNPYVQTGE